MNWTARKLEAQQTALFDVVMGEPVASLKAADQTEGRDEMTTTAAERIGRESEALADAIDALKPQFQPEVVHGRYARYLRVNLSSGGTVNVALTDRGDSWIVQGRDQWNTQHALEHNVPPAQLWEAVATAAARVLRSV